MDRHCCHRAGPATLHDAERVVCLLECLRRVGDMVRVLDDGPQGPRLVTQLVQVPEPITQQLI